jgi:hypothetical protein
MGLGGEIMGSTISGLKDGSERTVSNSVSVKEDGSVVGEVSVKEDVSVVGEVSVKEESISFISIDMVLSDDIYFR